MDSTTPSPERIELSYLKKASDGKIIHYTLKDPEVQVLIDEIQKEEEAATKAAEAATGDI